MNNSSLSIESLLVLDAIEQRGSFAAAAEQLDKVPSALSYIVQKLEEQLGVTIFVRQGRRSVLTPAGQHLLHEGRKLLQAVNKITEQTQTIAHGWEPKIRIAYDSIFDAKLVFRGIRGFLDDHANIEIDIREEVMNGSWEVLIEDKVDLIIGAPAPVPNQQGLRAVKIGHVEGVFVAHNQHQLVRAVQPIAKKDIASYRTVVVHDSAQHEIPWSSNIIEQSRHFYVTTIEQKIQAIVSGIGVGFLPKDRIQPYLDSGQLVAIELNEKAPQQELFIAWKIVNKGKGLQQLITRLQNQLDMPE